MKKLQLLLVAEISLILSLFLNEACVFAYEESNDFIPDVFPGTVDKRIFSIPLDYDELVIVCPSAAQQHFDRMTKLLQKKCGVAVSAMTPDEVTENQLSNLHLIIIGNISNNKYALDLYRRRYAFADAYFPGKDGVIIHPATSIWSRDRNVLVIGVSSDDDILKGFERLVGLIKKGATSIGALHLLDSNLTLPKPPNSIQVTVDHIRANIRTTMAPYWNIANWGLLYFLSGDIKWAEHFRDGMYLCYERGETTGQWVSESWTNLYFNLWKMVYAWDLLDDDPFFTPKDRKVIEEVLWGYTTFIRWMKNLDVEMAPLDEGRQNHTTFLALSLYYTHRYYTEKFGLTGLDSMVEKYRRAFDCGQAHSYRPNDDAGNYFYYAPLHMLTYQMAEGDDSFLTTGKLRPLIDLVVATIDNRRDPVSFGDVGGYRHRGKGAPRGAELKFFGMGAWHYGDPEHQWLYNWGSKERVISLDTMKQDGGKYENPIQMQFGADRVFTVEAMYSGVYAVDIDEKSPDRYTGVFPVLLDRAALKWSAMRSYKNTEVPSQNKLYFDKIAFRRNFDPEDEYLLLDGLSTFSHGHYDGNTVTRLTWKDRVWLFDLDYIKMTPKYHNGVVVVRDGVQEPPPPLNTLEFAADLETFGFTSTTSEDYCGADWERNIIWKKGQYFLFLDRITTKKAGDYRFENRWRTRGDVSLESNTLAAHQGDVSLRIVSADNAHRDIVREPDGHRSRWTYPYGDGVMSVCVATEEREMSPSDSFTFANIMYVEDSKTMLPNSLSRVSESYYVAGNSENPELIGLDPRILEDEGVYTDCRLFVKDTKHIWFLDATYIRFRNSSIEAPGRVHFEINVRTKKGKIIVPEKYIGKFDSRNIQFKDISQFTELKKDMNELGSVVKSFTLEFSFKGNLWKNKMPFKSAINAAHIVVPNKSPDIPLDFGIDVLSDFSVERPITAVTGYGTELYYGNTSGTISRFDGVSEKILYHHDAGRPILIIHAADINGDGNPELIAGNDKAEVFCISQDGNTLWTHTMTRFYGADANIRDIAVGDIDRSGTPEVLVSNGGWKLYAFEADGDIKWEAFCYYHPLTKLRILDNKQNGVYIPVGTEYHTVLNVVDAVTGRVVWHAWEEMGSEFISTTEYFGFHLTDLVLVDTDDDDDLEIVFGTKHNDIYSLEAKDGRMNWTAGVDSEVTVIRTFVCPKSGRTMILTATDSGGLFLHDRRGKLIRRVAVGSGIIDVEVLSRDGFDRIDIIVSTKKGFVIVYDNSFKIRASLVVGVHAIKDIVPVGFKGDSFTFNAVTDMNICVLSYHPYYLMKSRHY